MDSIDEYLAEMERHHETCVQGDEHPQHVEDLLKLVKKYREALDYVQKFGRSQCERACAPYRPYNRHHSTECPREYYLTADDALAFDPRKEGKK